VSEGVRLVLVDTGPLYAAVDTSDAYHTRALADTEYLAARNIGLALTIPVAVEAHGLLRRKLGLFTANRWLAETTPLVNLFEVSDRHFFAAVQLITRFSDQSLSLVDGILAIVSE